MKISTLLTLFPLLMPASVLAGTVLYTDSHHPPTNNDASVTVIYLDGPEPLQTQLFGALSSNPDEAQRQAQAVLQSPQWQAHEQELVTVYRAVVRAWELGVKKVPAVVFDDRDVVYGTADNVGKPFDDIGVSSCSFQGATMAHSSVQILARKSSASLTVAFTLSPRQCLEKRVSCYGYPYISVMSMWRDDE